jgi:hypothetical protein
MDPLILIALHVGLSLAALATMIFGFFTGARHQTQPIDRAMVCAIVGVLAGVVGIFAIAMGHSYIWTTAIFVGAFMTGTGIGLQVTERE